MKPFWVCKVLAFRLGTCFVVERQVQCLNCDFNLQREALYQQVRSVFFDFFVAH